VDLAEKFFKNLYEQMGMFFFCCSIKFAQKCVLSHLTLSVPQAIIWVTPTTGLWPEPQEIFIFVDFGQFCLFLAVPTKFRVIFHQVLGGFSPYNFRYVMGFVRYSIWFNKIFFK
jgi:hypothetical protein